MQLNLLIHFIRCRECEICKETPKNVDLIYILSNSCKGIAHANMVENNVVPRMTLCGALRGILVNYIHDNRYPLLTLLIFFIVFALFVAGVYMLDAKLEYHKRI